MQYLEVFPQPLGYSPKLPVILIQLVPQMVQLVLLLKVLFALVTLAHFPCDVGECWSHDTAGFV